MARPATIRDETIIDAAREVFLARGIRATTAEVAERAGVSEGSIFKRFKSKLELFEAAMGSPDEDPEFIRELSRRVGQGDMRENLYELGREIESHFRRAVPLVMMSWSNPGPDGTPVRLNGPSPAPVRVLKALIEYFDAEVRVGRLRPADPEVAARSFLGAIQNFVVFEVLFGPQPDLHLTSDAYVRALVQLAWSGLAPQDPAGGTRVRFSEHGTPS
ncbi:MAG TPA: TetR/AcrR family transcriptional regulator [Polyangiaceae bacterium]|nr:TetR/AcrR family transcriptional regulator [Polyangiaceae bacterium]